VAPQITRIKGLSKAPDVIVLCSFPPGGAVAVKQLREQGVDAPIIGNDAFDGDYWYKKTIPDLSNFWYNESSSIFGNDPDPKINTFWKKYTKVTKGPPQVSFGGFGYSAVQALALAIKRAGSTKGTAVAAQLDKFRNEPLLLGTTFTSKLHIDTHRAGRMMEIQNGKHTVAAVVKVQKQPPLSSG
jgi:branched-chain amino acid transport system substrate-binding protein